ncbi:MAG: hypothetical protein EOO38_25835 [Cytophagaceae bacterium]|nr:MAG: hypothetical protein EOO38_25835 [Cytophagaceae bacterium]
MLIEKPNYIKNAHYHFSVPISDQAYFQIAKEVQLWRDDPGHLWDIDKRNCVTFVGVIAQMAGLKADFPSKIMRKPRAYLDHLATLNPLVQTKAP